MRFYILFGLDVVKWDNDKYASPKKSLELKISDLNKSPGRKKGIPKKVKKIESTRPPIAQRVNFILIIWLGPKS